MRLLVYFLAFLIGTFAAGTHSPAGNIPCDEKTDSGSARLFAENLWFSDRAS